MQPMKIYQYDQKWLNSTSRSINDKITTAELLLNNLKRDGERDEIKIAYLSLADLYGQRGEYQQALTKYLESKEYSRK